MRAGARRPARSLPAHAVNGPARGLPEVVGEARAERWAELGDVRAPRRRAGKWAGRHTPPAFVLCFVLAPELVLLDELLVGEDNPTRYRVSPLHRRKGSDACR